ncbi:MAG: S-layer homology domain-containing protein [Clostridiales bacterium]|nr:S-layer homology domain-containing protein [Clostridiales bacterium]
MKSLNRTLSLVLVLAMVFGLFGVASAATFSDNASVQYTEAVGVMTGIGAINGYADGTFKPAGTITREEAAKMVAYAILGPNVASKLSVTATGFKDVDATRWSAPYIAFCVSRGIINGMGDGTFAPTANVTGYQLGKMLLCAAGYGAKDEFKGPSWTLNVAVMGGKCKIFSGAKTTDYSKPATREEAALYIFNGITKTPQVSYSKLTETYTAIEEPGAIGDDKLTYTIAEQVYPTLVSQSITVNGTLSYYWTLDGKAITGYIDNATVLATSSDGTALAKLVDASKSEYIGYAMGTYVNVYVNGVRQTSATPATGKTNADYSIDEIKAITTYDNQKGVVIKFLDTGTDSKYDVVTITKPTAVQLSMAPVVAKTGSITTVTIPGVVGTATDAKKVIGYEGLAKGDYVMYYTDENGITFITKCGTFTGTLKGINTYANSIVVDGKSYYMSQINGAAAASTLSGLANRAATFYTDAAGYVVAADLTNATVSLDNTVFVLATSAVEFGTCKAQVLTGDGSISVITVAKLNSNIVTAAPDANKFYTFTKNDNGTYNLSSFADQGAISYTTAQTAIARNTPIFLKDNSGSTVSVLANEATVFMYISATGSVTKYTGISNVPSYTTANGSVVAYVKDARGYATFVVAKGGTPDSTVSAKDYVFAVTPATTVYDTAGNYYTYVAVVNGKITTANSTLSCTLAPLGLYSVNQYERTTLISGVKTAHADDARLSEFNGTDTVKRFIFNGSTVTCYDSVSATNLVSAFVVSSDCKYFIVDSTKYTVNEVTAADVAALIGGTYKIYGVNVSSTDTRVAQLFVVK